MESAREEFNKAYRLYRKLSLIRRLFPKALYQKRMTHSALKEMRKPIKRRALKSLTDRERAS